MQKTLKDNAVLFALPEPIDYPINFNGGKFLPKVIRKDGQDLKKIVFISSGISIQEEKSKIFTTEQDYLIKGTDENGLKVFQHNLELLVTERVNQRNLLIVNWRVITEPIHASLSILIGIYEDGTKEKLSEITNGYMLGGYYKILQKNILNYILNNGVE